MVEFTVIDNNKQAILFIELKGQNQGLDDPQASYNGKTSIQQAHNYAISNDNIVWYIVFNYNELRIYNKYEGYLKEKYISFNIGELKDEDPYFIILLLSKKFFKDQKLIDEIKKDTIIVEKKITDSIYKLYHETRLILIRQIHQYNELNFNDAIKYAQLILNRIIFICFTEDKGLLPNQILEETINQQISNRTLRKNRQSIWNELNYLFEDINSENRIRKITGYDGILFKENIGFLKIPDLFDSAELFKDLSQEHKIQNDSVDIIIRSYQNSVDGFINLVYYNLLLLASFNFNTEIDVNILGHIFEQSLTDLEELQKSFNLEEKAKKSRDLRKKEGIYYTPKYITDYICRKSIITYLSNNTANNLEELVDEYEENLNDLEKKMKELKILDLACGSGAFLNMAMVILLEIHKLIYMKQNQNHILNNNQKNHVDILKFTKEDEFNSIAINIKREIAVNNLFGVDKNSESIGITELAFFLQTARKEKSLPNLTNNIKNGNSIIDNENNVIEENLANELNIFNWNIEFAEILENGFDIIIGNPPYIRRESISEVIKPILEKKFSIYHGNADLYCYFYEKALNLLKKGGVLSFISSNKWMKTDYGGKLRYLLYSYYIQEIIDFFELRVFKDASTEPAIIVMKKIEQKNNEVKVTLMDTLDFDDFNQYVLNNQFIFNQNHLIAEKDFINQDKSMGIWNFTGPIANSILNKFNEGSISLLDYLGGDMIKMGIKPERVNVFRITKEKRDSLIEIDKRSKEIIKSLLIGTEIEKYGYNFQDYFFILTRKGINIDNYKAIKEYLSLYKDDLEQRDSVIKGDSKWYELRPCDYYDYFENDKIVYIHTAKKHKFALDTENHYLTNNCYIINSSDKYLLAYLNSNMFEFFKINRFVAFGDPRTKGRCKIDYKKMNIVPIKNPNEEQRSFINNKIDEMIKLTKSFIEKRENFLGFIKSNYGLEKTSKKLNLFWELTPKIFLNEIKKKFKKIKMKELQQLYNLYLTAMENDIVPLIHKIEVLNDDINSFFYDIYGINEKEKDFIEQFIK